MPTLEVDCPSCGATAGSPCIGMAGTKAGQPLKGGKLHRERRIVRSANEVSDAAVDKFFAVNKQQRVDQVIWAIMFARDIMRVPQEQLDRNLAEMIVEAELDMKLF